MGGYTSIFITRSSRGGRQGVERADHVIKNGLGSGHFLPEPHPRNKGFPGLRRPPSLRPLDIRMRAPKPRPTGAWGAAPGITPHPPPPVCWRWPNAGKQCTRPLPVSSHVNRESRSRQTGREPLLDQERESSNRLAGGSGCSCGRSRMGREADKKCSGVGCRFGYLFIKNTVHKGNKPVQCNAM